MIKFIDSTNPDKELAGFGYTNSDGNHESVTCDENYLVIETIGHNFPVDILDVEKFVKAFDEARKLHERRYGNKVSEKRVSHKADWLIYLKE